MKLTKRERRPRGEFTSGVPLESMLREGSDRSNGRHATTINPARKPEVSHQELTLDPMQQRKQARFRHMGLSARAMPGGRSLLVSLTLGPAPFESVAGPEEPRSLFPRAARL
jgi:hypothetical protein